MPCRKHLAHECFVGGHDCLDSRGFVRRHVAALLSQAFRLSDVDPVSVRAGVSGMGYGPLLGAGPAGGRLVYFPLPGKILLTGPVAQADGSSSGRMTESAADWKFPLPDVAGRIALDRPMASLSWLRVGGVAEMLFQPAHMADISAFMQQVPESVPVMPIGVCSNLIIRDGGIKGAVIRLGSGFN